MKRNALDLWPPSILWDAPLSLARMPPFLEGRTWRGSPLFRKQGAHPVSSPSRRLITLADRFTSERTDPAEAPGGAAAFSCSPEVPGCGLGPGCCAAARCHARAVPAPRPSAVSPAACPLPRRLCSRTFPSKICTALAEGMCALNRTPPFHPPSIKSAENPSVSNM